MIKEVRIGKVVVKVAPPSGAPAIDPDMLKMALKSAIEELAEEHQLEFRTEEPDARPRQVPMLPKPSKPSKVGGGPQVLTDKDVLKLRRKGRKKIGRGERTAFCEKHAKRLRVDATTIHNACTGTSFKHLDEQEPPWQRLTGKLTDDDVLKLRRKGWKIGYGERWAFCKEQAKRLGVGANTIHSACMGVDFAHLDKQEPLWPRLHDQVLTDKNVLKLRRKGRKIGYGERWAFYKEQAKRLGVGVNTIHNACMGVDFAHLDKQEPPWQRLTGKLTDDDVLKLRRKGRKIGYGERKDFFVKEAKRLGVNRETIRHACMGYSFKHLDEQEPPWPKLS